MTLLEVPTVTGEATNGVEPDPAPSIARISASAICPGDAVFEDSEVPESESTVGCEVAGASDAGGDINTLKRLRNDGEAEEDAGAAVGTSPANIARIPG